MSYNGSAAFCPRGTVISYETPLTSSVVTALAEIKEINFTGAKFDLAETTNYQSGVFKEWLTTLADSGEVSFSGNYLPLDASQQALLGFFNAGTLVSWFVTLPNSLGVITFKGYVQSLEHNLPIDKQATISGKIKVTGAIAGF